MAEVGGENRCSKPGSLGPAGNEGWKIGRDLGFATLI